ncbi:MAG: signal peptidase I [Dehalococcoidia bacterium]
MRAALREVLITVLLAVVFFMAIRAFVHNYEVQGFSMEPALHDGQYIVVSKAAYWFGDPHRGDIVVFDSSKINHGIIHRVVGLPGETVEIDDGNLYVNGEGKREPYVEGDSISASPREIPEDSYFIIGDNRSAASWDIVSEADIIGKAWLCYWPISELGLVPNYSWEQDDSAEKQSSPGATSFMFYKPLTKPG